MNTYRDEVCEYVENKYKTEIEFPWFRFPTYCVFRHRDNKKWYGLIMRIPYTKLGVGKDGDVDILNVKIDDHLLRDVLLSQNGVFVGYHIAKGSWISLSLDGSVDLKLIFELLDMSFVATGQKKVKPKV